MARITVRIRPVHHDLTLCGHRVSAAGKALDAGCPGRQGYEARCPLCGWRRISRTRRALIPLADVHLAEQHARP